MYINQSLYFVDAQAPPSLPVEDVGQAKHSESSFVSKKIRFAYFEVQEMTNNFQRVLGEGGFGVVFECFVYCNQQKAFKIIYKTVLPRRGRLF